MQDAFRPLFSWRREPIRLVRAETEIIDFQDRVAFAAGLIRDHELRLWFERDESTARAVARLCPECTVFTIPTGAYLIDRLGGPPAWRRSARRGPYL